MALWDVTLESGSHVSPFASKSGKTLIWFHLFSNEVSYRRLVLDVVAILIQKFLLHYLEVTEIACCESVEQFQCFSLETLEEDGL